MGCKQRSNRREAGSGGATLALRRILLVALPLLALQLGAASSAQASSLYWYGENNSTCWQSGFPNTLAPSCDSVGAHYLPTGPRMYDLSPREGNGGVGFDVKLSPSGDWCNYYRLPEGLNTTDENRESEYTGYEPPSPLGSYQEANLHYRDVCQADGTNWGHEIRASSEGYHAAFGMQHYVSLIEQGTNDRPWSAAFENPSLAISVEANPNLLQGYGNKHMKGWGYVCPILKDASTGNYIEYCIEEWGTVHNPKFEEGTTSTVECNSPGGNNIDTIWSQFRTGAQFATIMPGTEPTYSFEYPGWKHFGATIKTTNLKSAIETDKSICGGRAHSLNPAEYALVGIENGIEIEGEASLLGASERNLQVSSEYSSAYAPAVTTEAATNVHESEATLNGTVNPNGADTHYYFEYGTTKGYGSKTPEVDAGSGTKNVHAEAALSNLQLGTEYHYRLIATNLLGSKSVGGDRTLTTVPRAVPGIIRNASTGEQWVYYVGKNGSQVWQWWWNTTKAEWVGHDLGGEEVAAGTSPTAVLNASTGEQWVYYVGKDHAIWQWWWNTTKAEWVGHDLGGEVATGTSPAVVQEPSTGEQWVYYVGKNGSQVWQWSWSPTKAEWAPYELGGEVAAGTSPTAVRNASTGEQWVYYVGKNGSQVWQWSWSPTKTEWAPYELGGEVEAGTSPAVVQEPSTGEQWVYYVGSSGSQVWQWWWSPSRLKWYSLDIGGEARP
jgi:hypothetical protein